MPSRIPIKIFRLQQTQAGVFDLAPTRFVTGVTTSDIVTSTDGTELINIGQTPANQPLAVSSTTRVYTDSFGKYVILDGAEKLYIRPTTLVTSSENLPFTFEFYVNPQRLSPNYTKIVSEMRTRGGWEVQHWGDALTELRVEGKSGGMHRRGNVPRINRDTTAAAIEAASAQAQQSGDGLQEGQDITDTEAWRRLSQLRQLYDVDHAIRNQEQLTLLGIAVYDSFYVGYFTSFSGPNQDAMEPYQFSYSFTMKILYETNVSTFNPSVKASVTAGTTSTFAKIRDFNQ